MSSCWCASTKRPLLHILWGNKQHPYHMDLRVFSSSYTDMRANSGSKHCSICLELVSNQKDCAESRVFGRDTWPSFLREREDFLRSASRGCDGCSILNLGIDLILSGLPTKQLTICWHPISKLQRPLYVGHSHKGEIQFYVQKRKSPHCSGYINVF